MRGHRILSGQARHHAVDAVCTTLAQTPLPVPADAFSSLIFGAATPHAELATRQFLYLRVGLYKITAPLFALEGRAGSSLVYPLPGHWIRLLRQQGIPVNGSASRALWMGAVMFFWAYGCMTLGKLLVGAVVSLRSNAPDLSDYAHFEYIGTPQTPRPGPDGQSHDVVTWYRSWAGRNMAVKQQSCRTRAAAETPADPKVTALQLPVLIRISPSALLRFVGWAIAAVALSFFHMLRGRWWHALMLYEAVLARFIATVEPEALARDYLFNNSGWFQRPLWTYEAEKRGSRIIFYHYSTNSAEFKQDDGYPAEHHSWSLSNWPRHLVWDEHHEHFVRRAVGRPVQTETVGPIWFSSSPEAPPLHTHPTIAVFDVTPFRPSKAPSLALRHNYYAPATCNAFIDDIAKACSGAGIGVAWKRKRNIGKAAHPQYRLMSARVDAAGLAEIVSADHSPVRVIEASDAVISMPFTSTATLARHLGKPSCYYDPTGLVHRDDHGAHDIPILHGYDELEKWIRSLRIETMTMDEN